LIIIQMVIQQELPEINLNPYINYINKNIIL